MADNYSVEVNNEKERKQYIAVQIGGERYGIDIGFVDNIVRMPKITRVPKAQVYFKGIMNLRGEIVPVMSMRIRMGLEDDVFTKDSRVIILKMEEGMIGVIVDRVNEVVALSEDEIERNVKDAKHNKSEVFINGIGKNNNQLISLLEINAIIEGVV